MKAVTPSREELQRRIAENERVLKRSEEAQRRLSRVIRETERRDEERRARLRKAGILI